VLVRDLGRTPTLIDTPFQGGPATWVEDIELQINRAGFSEETHFTVAYSPVPDETVAGGIGGVLATVHEITEKVIGERRGSILRELGSGAGKRRRRRMRAQPQRRRSKSIGRMFQFALIYLTDSDVRKARLAACCGFEGSESLAPQDLDLNETSEIGSAMAAARRAEEMQIVTDLASVFPVLPAGPWPERPHTAVVVPIRSNIPHQVSASS
jgi:hypothetical protein